MKRKYTVRTLINPTDEKLERLLNDGYNIEHVVPVAASSCSGQVFATSVYFVLIKGTFTEDEE